MNIKAYLLYWRGLGFLLNLVILYDARLWKKTAQTDNPIMQDNIWVVNISSKETIKEKYFFLKSSSMISKKYKESVFFQRHRISPSL